MTRQRDGLRPCRCHSSDPSHQPQSIADSYRDSPSARVVGRGTRELEAPGSPTSNSDLKSVPRARLGMPSLLEGGLAPSPCGGLLSVVRATQQSVNQRPFGPPAPNSIQPVWVTQETHSYGLVRGGAGRSSPCVCHEGADVGWESELYFEVVLAGVEDKLPDLYVRQELRYFSILTRWDGARLREDRIWHEFFKVRADGTTIHDYHWIQRPYATFCAVSTEVSATLSLSCVRAKDGGKTSDYISVDPEVYRERRQGEGSWVVVKEDSHSAEDYRIADAASSSGEYKERYDPDHCWDEYGLEARLKDGAAALGPVRARSVRRAIATPLDGQGPVTR